MRRIRENHPICVGEGFCPARAVRYCRLECTNANTHAPVGADASVRPLGNGKFAAAYRENGRAYRAGRFGHRPLQMWYEFALVSPYLRVRPAGQTGSSAPTDAFVSALVHPNLHRRAAGRGSTPSLRKFDGFRGFAAKRFISPCNTAGSGNSPQTPGL